MRLLYEKIKAFLINKTALSFIILVLLFCYSSIVFAIAVYQDTIEIGNKFVFILSTAAVACSIISIYCNWAARMNITPDGFWLVFSFFTWLRLADESEEEQEKAVRKQKNHWSSGAANFFIITVILNKICIISEICIWIWF